MIDIINKIFKKDNSTFDSIQTNQDRIHLATCAVLLEMANIDGEFSSEERDNIVSVFKSRYGLNKKDIDELMEASVKELNESVDLWHFTNLINRNYSLEQKQQIIETVWQVAYSDGRLDKHEDYFVHKLAGLLNLDHKQLIDAKIRAQKVP